MNTLFDYLDWRGDLSFEQAPFGPVDNLILSTLAYVPMEGLIPTDAGSVTLKEAAASFLSLSPMPETRSKEDPKLLRALMAAPRFQSIALSFYTDLLDETRALQFAALCCDLGKARFLAFQGTDASLVGWKEDFNLCFMEQVAAQVEASAYLRRVAASCTCKLLLGGHSKGGHLALYAATHAEERLQARICAIYNNDGPGLTERQVQSAGFKAIEAKLHRFLPEASVVGVLLEQSQEKTLVQSSKQGFWQHDPYSWKVLGDHFIEGTALSYHSRMAVASMRSFLQDLPLEERRRLIDTLYDLLSAGQAKKVKELAKAKQIEASLKAFTALNLQDKKKVAKSLFHLVKSATVEMLPSKKA